LNHQLRIYSRKRVKRVNNREFNKGTDRKSWLVDLPPNVLVKPIDPSNITNFIFFTGSFIRFKNKHQIPDMKAAIILRKLVNDAYKIDEDDVINWYRYSVFDNFDSSTPDIKVDSNRLDVNINLYRFENNNQFKAFLDSTIIFVNAL
jgi:hypothetical protein